jgi:hypothetical protein
VVLRDIVVRRADADKGAAPLAAESDMKGKVNKNKQESMHKIALKALVDRAESEASAFDKAKLLWSTLQPYLVAMEEDSRKLAVTAIKELLMWATDSQVTPTTLDDPNNPNNPNNPDKPNNPDGPDNPDNPNNPNNPNYSNISNKPDNPTYPNN